MSTTVEPAAFDLREQLARIDRALAEAEKLREETIKFRAEQRKLMAEADKLTWDRFLAPWFVAASLSGGIVVALVNHFWK